MPLGSGEFHHIPGPSSESCGWFSCDSGRTSGGEEVRPLQALPALTVHDSKARVPAKTRPEDHSGCEIPSLSSL